MARKNTHKYGIEVPQSVEYARELDKKNGNTYWEDVVKKEMYYESIAFEILEEGQKSPPSWNASSSHIVFDVKMDFTRNAQWVKDDHKIPDPD